MSPIRILRIIARLNTGGPAIHTVLLSAGLDPRGFRSRLVTGVVDPTEGDMTYYARRLGVTPTVLPVFGRLMAGANVIRTVLALRRLISQERPHVVHTHTMTAGGVGRIAALLYNLSARRRRHPRVRLVHTFHGHLFHGYYSWLRSRLLVAVERFLARFTDQLIAVSDAVKADLVGRYRVCADQKVTVVNLGLDLEWTRRVGRVGSLRDVWRVPPTVVTIGAVGRLTEVKNHRLLLAALSQLRGLGIRALIVGDGRLRGTLEREVTARDLGGLVTFTGWEQDPARIYGALDIVCLTSRNEGTPVALIEAMAAGRPVVATAVGGVPDIMAGRGVEVQEGFTLYGNGVLVPAEDPGILAAALRYLVERPDVRREMGAVGHTSVVTRFSRERLIRDMETLYTALVMGGATTEA